MSQVGPALTHLHQKRGISFNSIIEKLAYLAGIANPIGTIPQAYEIWTRHDATGVSMFTWMSFLLISIVLTIYSAIHKEKPLMMMYGALIIVNFMVVLGIVIY